MWYKADERQYKATMRPSPTAAVGCRLAARVAGRGLALVLGEEVREALAGDRHLGGGGEEGGERVEVALHDREEGEGREDLRGPQPPAHRGEGDEGDERDRDRDGEVEKLRRGLE